MKALLLRVGMDKGVGGCLAPIFPNGAFEFIPIPEKKSTNESRTYNLIVGNNNLPLSVYLPQTLRRLIPHFDPEFETFTYGDPTANKRRQLLELAPGDLLIFYAGLDPHNPFDVSRLYIIGYFKIVTVYDFGKAGRSRAKVLGKRLPNNAHLKRKYYDKKLVVVQGDSAGSKLLARALPLGDTKHTVIPDIIPALGYGGSLLRAVGHWVKDKHAIQILSYLRGGLMSLITDDTRLYSYVLASDTGFSPNVTSGICTLGCCKPDMRRVARVGDWIIGTLSKRYGAHRLGYCMRVSEIIPFRKYYRDKRFESKKPEFDIHGDNIYYRSDDKYKVVPNLHHNGQNLDGDTKVDRVLIGALFWYFGANAITIPEVLKHIIKKGRKHRKIVDTHYISNFVNWISTDYRIGVHGPPRDKTRISDIVPGSKCEHKYTQKKAYLYHCGRFKGPPSFEVKGRRRMN